MQIKLSEPNSKLGGGIWGWSIPAKRTCPGATQTCAASCYAAKGRFFGAVIQNRLALNYEGSTQPEFVQDVLALIRVHGVRTLRIHVAGDFYDAGYIRKWVQIVRMAKHVQFYAYTRSWRQPELLPLLVRLARLPNFRMWWSEDSQTGPSPDVAGVMRAYMATSDEDAAARPDHADLVFRVSRKTVMKRAAGTRVCPAENGMPYRQKVTCDRCRICFKPAKEPAYVAGVGTGPVALVPLDLVVG